MVQHAPKILASKEKDTIIGYSGRKFEYMVTLPDNNQSSHTHKKVHQNLKKIHFK